MNATAGRTTELFYETFDVNVIYVDLSCHNNKVIIGASDRCIPNCSFSNDCLMITGQGLN